FLKNFELRISDWEMFAAGCDVLRLGRSGARQVSDLPKKHFTLRVSDPNEWLGGSKTPGFKRACTASQRLAAHPNGLAVVETCRNPVIMRTDAARNCEPPKFTAKPPASPTIHCKISAQLHVYLRIRSFRFRLSQRQPAFLFQLGFRPA